MADAHDVRVGLGGRKYADAVGGGHLNWNIGQLVLAGIYIEFFLRRSHLLTSEYKGTWVFLFAFFFNLVPPLNYSAHKPIYSAEKISK